MSDMELYSNYFPVGKKVGVGIPLPNADIFRDWAIIHEMDEDLVSLQLSRDTLPESVSLHYGQILELRGGNEESAYSCRAIIVSEGDARELLLRLIGEVVSDELREFYRIDAFLPIKYFVSKEQNIDKLRKQWEERREQRQQLEIDLADRRWSGAAVLPEGATLPLEPREGLSETDGDGIVPVPDAVAVEEVEQDPWDTIIPLAANISGGGLRIITHQGFEYGEYTLLEIMVPSPRRVVDAIGRVVFANRNFSAGKDREYFNTGVQFVYIEERDRDAIVGYISNIQLKRIRQLRERYLYRGILESEELSGNEGVFGFKRRTTRVAAVVIFVVICALLIDFYRNYVLVHPKGQIQRTFEDSIRKYREQQKPN